MIKLFLVRHAKSSRSIPELKDIDRPLTEKGYHDARHVAKLLSKLKTKPDLMITSPAVRAITTSLIFARELKFPYAEIKLNENIYTDDFKKIIKVIESIKPEYKNVFIFGHNPAFEELAQFISSSKIPRIKTSDILCFELGEHFKLSKNSHPLLASYSAERTTVRKK
jgi:phosphohistidine phosphatase